jgi:hypothetical protein
MEMAQGTFDLWQQTFVLSNMANADYGFEVSIKESLTEHLKSSIQNRLANAGLRNLIGASWELAWGPCVFRQPLSAFADNAMYVAHDKVNNIYVVAVAATNIRSIYDILIEDLHIKPVAWPYGGSVPEGTEIATGTRDGVDKLLAMKSHGQALLPYLQGVAGKPDSTLIFAGHSLGGALSPTLAMALTEKGLNLADWKAVHVYPTAGPTPGNATFSAYFSQKFPQSATGSQPWQVWNADVANSLDIVPRAWNSQTLATIPTLYAPNVTVSSEFATLVATKVKNIQHYHFTRIGTAKDLTSSSVQGSGDVFAKEAQYQHVYAYFQLLGIQALLELTDAKGDLLFPVVNPFAPAPQQPAAATA